MIRLTLIALFAILFSHNSNAEPVYNPVNKELLRARTGEERYWILYKMHKKAKEDGASIVYKGIDTLNLSIPYNALPIPLPHSVDFGGIVFNVINKSKDISLFELTNETKSIEIQKRVIDIGNYKRYKQLKKGEKLVLLKDENPWVKQRRGYQYGHMREDIVLLKDGIAENAPVSPYNNKQTFVVSKYCDVDSEEKVIKNVKLVRDKGCTSITSLITIINQYNVHVSDIEIYTPANSHLTKDRAIVVSNSYGITFEDIKIKGTYSKPDKSGYGISMNNVSNILFINLIGSGNWGIFGCNNVSTVTLSNCDINRFDIHCYGKDIYCENSTFRDLYNQFSSMNGSVVFKDCRFINFIPFLFETTYNAYTEFNLVFQNCKIWASKDRDYLVDARGLAGVEIDARPELRFQKYPRISIEDLTVYINGSISSFSVYRKGKNILNKYSIKSVPGLVKFEGVKIKRM